MNSEQAMILAQNKAITDAATGEDFSNLVAINKEKSRAGLRDLIANTEKMVSAEFEGETSDYSTDLKR